ncbi:MAG: proline--tRNA ligase [Oscillospiraceae bacterium]|nr:proline--tRNA ligase [Oscillospiraceae bacterium]
MKLETLVGERFKERPSDCHIDSHAFMQRGGYIKYVAGGIYSSFTPMLRVTQKIERILREEMDAIGGQEVLFPVVMPASLWEESGRYESVGNELMRITDRNDSPYLLGMTHEEAAVHLVREYGQTYVKYPFMIYQIQTKFRDEARPRGGLIRAREFTMKDAYSFHTSQEDLERYYEKCLEAYQKICKRVGLPDVVIVASDSGMMGGAVSHEFMLLTQVGEDSIAVCSGCGYRANVEAAESIIKNVPGHTQEITLQHTPDVGTIEDVCKFLNLPAQASCKAVIYQRADNGKTVVLFIRGDIEVNETKLVNHLGCEIRPAVLSENSGLSAGFIGPYNLEDGFTVLFDRSLQGINSLCCGANKKDYHYTGFNIERDCKEVEYGDFAKIFDGGICPECNQSTIEVLRGIELFNIFQLGTKYTKAMNMQYVDKDGNSQYPVMGCYGIGVGRLAASVCEVKRDDYGPIWPISIAPWQVHICCVRADDEEVKACADNLYSKLTEHGVEVIYDDRIVSAGVMFSDADLLGVPVRVIVSPRNIKENCCEIVTRDKTISRKTALDGAEREITEMINQMLSGSIQSS